MRKLLVFTNISLDGYFEGPEHDLSAFKNDFEAFPTEPGDQAGSLLFGRKTYEMMKFWATPQAAAMAPEVARFMNTTHKYVASHILFDPGWEACDRYRPGCRCGGPADQRAARGKYHDLRQQ